MRTFLTLATLVLFMSCFDDERVAPETQELNPSQVAALFDASSVIKDINQQMVSTLLEHPNLHGLGNGRPHAPVKDDNCPKIYPDPEDVKDFFPVHLSFDFTNDTEGCLPVGSSVRYKGIFFLEIFANVCLPGGAFRFYGSNFWLGENLTLSVDSVDVLQEFRTINRDTLIFDTDVKSLVCLNNGLFSNNLEDKRFTAVRDVKGGVTKYVDVEGNTRLDDYNTLIDDVVIFEFDELTAVDKETGQLMVCENGRLEYNVKCTCPVAGTFDMVSPATGRVDFANNQDCIGGNYTFNGESFQMSCQ